MGVALQGNEPGRHPVLSRLGSAGGRVASAESTAAEVEGNWVRIFALSSHNPVSCTRASTMHHASVSFCKMGDSCFKMNKK